ncbi:MAG: hypothetical protein IKH53_09585, partial [Muribaculaceae bacterium]|nr:hypothetical protein [Muribaculaceae bacterium]
MYRIYITLSSLFLLLTGFTAMADELPDSCLANEAAAIVATDIEAAAIEGVTTAIDTSAKQPDTVVINADDELPMCCFAVGPSYYREYKGPDFHFLKNTTNYSIKPYTFMQDQT